MWRKLSQVIRILALAGLVLPLAQDKAIVAYDEANDLGTQTKQRRELHMPYNPNYHCLFGSWNEQLGEYLGNVADFSCTKGESNCERRLDMFSHGAGGSVFIWDQISNATVTDCGTYHECQLVGPNDGTPTIVNVLTSQNGPNQLILNVDTTNAYGQRQWKLLCVNPSHNETGHQLVSVAYFQVEVSGECEYALNDPIGDIVRTASDTVPHEFVYQSQQLVKYSGDAGNAQPFRETTGQTKQVCGNLRDCQASFTGVHNGDSMTGLVFFSHVTETFSLIVYLNSAFTTRQVEISCEHPQSDRLITQVLNFAVRVECPSAGANSAVSWTANEASIVHVSYIVGSNVVASYFDNVPSISECSVQVDAVDMNEPPNVHIESTSRVWYDGHSVRMRGTAFTATETFIFRIRVRLGTEVALLKDSFVTITLTVNRCSSSGLSVIQVSGVQPTTYMIQPIISAQQILVYVSNSNTNAQACTISASIIEGGDNVEVTDGTGAESFRIGLKASVGTQNGNYTYTISFTSLDGVREDISSYFLYTDANNCLISFTGDMDAGWDFDTPLQETTVTLFASYGDYSSQFNDCSGLEMSVSYDGANQDECNQISMSFDPNTGRIDMTYPPLPHDTFCIILPILQMSGYQQVHMGDTAFSFRCGQNSGILPSDVVQRTRFMNGYDPELVSFRDESLNSMCQITAMWPQTRDVVFDELTYSDNVDVHFLYRIQGDSLRSEGDKTFTVRVKLSGSQDEIDLDGTVTLVEPPCSSLSQVQSLEVAVQTEYRDYVLNQDDYFASSCECNGFSIDSSQIDLVEQYNRSERLYGFRIDSTVVRGEYLIRFECQSWKLPPTNYYTDEFLLLVVCNSESTSLTGELEPVSRLKVYGVPFTVEVPLFASSNPACPIRTHELIPYNGSYQFYVSDPNMTITLDGFYSIRAGIYSYGVRATTDDGLVYTTNSTMTILEDCRDGRITQTEGAQEVLVLQLPIEEDFIVNLTGKFESYYGPDCLPTQFNITRVVQDQVDLDLDSQTPNYLTENDTFIIRKTASGSLNQALVFIQASNGQVQGGDYQHLINLTLLEATLPSRTATQSSNSSSQTAKVISQQANCSEEGVLRCNETLRTSQASFVSGYYAEIAVDKMVQPSLYYLSTNTSTLTDLVSLKSLSFVSFVRINQTIIIQVDIGEVVIGSYEGNFTLTDFDGLQRSYKLKVRVMSSQLDGFNPDEIIKQRLELQAAFEKAQLGQLEEPQVFRYIKPWMSTIEPDGIAKIRFNDSIGDFDITAFNNETVSAYIEVSELRKRIKGFDAAKLHFTWTASLKNYKEIQIQLKWENPLQISPLVSPDKLVLILDKVKESFIKKGIILSQYNLQETSLSEGRRLRGGRTTLKQDNREWRLEARLKPQLPYDQMTEVAIDSTEKLSDFTMLIVAFAILIGLLDNSDLLYMTLLIRALVQIITLPVFSIIWPANFLMFVELTIQIALMDYLDYFGLWDHLEWLGLKQDNKFPQQLKSENMSFGSHGAIQNLSTLSVILIVMILQILLALALKMLLMCGCRVKRAYRKVAKELFFSTIVSFAAEGFLELGFAAYFNLANPYTDSFGEVINLILTACIVIMCVFILPYGAIKVMTVSKRIIREDRRTRSTWKSLIQHLRTGTRQQRAYFLVFIIRRALFLLIGLANTNPDYALLCILAQIYLNTMSAIFLGRVRPFEERRWRRIEFFNEAIVQMVTFFCILFTSLMQDPELKYWLGWWPSFFGCLLIAVNVAIMVMNQLHAANLIIQRYTNIAVAKYKASREKARKYALEQEKAEQDRIARTVPVIELEALNLYMNALNDTDIPIQVKEGAEEGDMFLADRAQVRQLKALKTGDGETASQFQAYIGLARWHQAKRKRLQEEEKRRREEEGEVSPCSDPETPSSESDEEIEELKKAEIACKANKAQAKSRSLPDKNLGSAQKPFRKEPKQTLNQILEETRETKPTFRLDKDGYVIDEPSDAEESKSDTDEEPVEIEHSKPDVVEKPVEIKQTKPDTEVQPLEAQPNKRRSKKVKKNSASYKMKMRQKETRNQLLDQIEEQQQEESIKSSRSCQKEAGEQSRQEETKHSEKLAPMDGKPMSKKARKKERERLRRAQLAD